MGAVDEDEARASTRRGARGRDVATVGAVRLAGYLAVSERAPGVVFVHGSRSSKHSLRIRYVASMLNDAGAGHVAIRPAHPRGVIYPFEEPRLPYSRSAHAHRLD